eukprot:SM005231S17509  [mRNA]  locus=s5231:1:1002:- [translate_table: standard]
MEMFSFFYALLHGWTYEHGVLLDLVRKGHHDAGAKLGAVPPTAFQVRVHPEYLSRCFYVVRADGTADDFSYRKCVDRLMALPPGVMPPAAGGGGGRRSGGGS